MQKALLEKLTDYERKQAVRVIKMSECLENTGMTRKQAVKRIIRDLERSHSMIRPDFVRLVLNP